MKIFLTARVNFDNYYGDSIHVLELFNGFRKYGQVHLFTYSSKNLKKGGDITLIRTGNPGNILLKLAVDMFYELKLFYYLLYHGLRERPDIIYSRYAVQNISPVLASKLLRVPLVTEVNSLPKNQLYVFNNRRIAGLADRVIGFLNYNLSDSIIVVEDSIGDAIRAKYNVKNIYTIPNGGNMEIFRPMSRPDCIEKLGLIAGRRYLCYVGILAKWQGLDYLVNSAKRLFADFPDLDILVVGDGMYKDELLKKVDVGGFNGRIIFTGMVPYEIVPYYINCADVCVAPFMGHRQASPLKIFNYMSCAKPVVASDITGVHDILSESGGGILVPPEDEAALADAISGLMRDEGLMISLGEKGRLYVTQHYSWDATIKKILAVCESLTGKSK